MLINVRVTCVHIGFIYKNEPPSDPLNRTTVCPKSMILKTCVFFAFLRVELV